MITQPGLVLQRAVPGPRTESGFIPVTAAVVVGVGFEAEDGKDRNGGVNGREAVDTPDDEGVPFTIVSAKRRRSMVGLHIQYSLNSIQYNNNNDE